MDYSVKIFFPAIALYLTSKMTAFEPSRKIYSMTPEKSKFSIESVLQKNQLLGMSGRVKGL
jgi:hypothetical protein